MLFFKVFSCICDRKPFVSFDLEAFSSRGASRIYSGSAAFFIKINSNKQPVIYVLWFVKIVFWWHKFDMKMQDIIKKMMHIFNLF